MKHETPAIRVLIADDHAMVREGLRRMLPGPEFQVVAEAASGREAATLTADLDPDVVLMDVAMPDMDGLTALGAIKRRRPEAAVVMLSTYESPSYMVRAIALGAAGYILKGVDREVLLDGLRAAAAGEAIIGGEVGQSAMEKLVGELARHPMEAGPERLTARESQVLALVAEGLTNAQIGKVLDISTSTARTHVQSIIQKLGVADRTQAAVKAVQGRSPTGR